MSIILTIAAVLAIIYGVPLVIYSAASALGWLQALAQSSPQAFLLGILITKLGTAVTFVLILQLSVTAWSGHWLLYAGVALLHSFF